MTLINLLKATVNCIVIFIIVIVILISNIIFVVIIMFFYINTNFLLSLWALFHFVSVNFFFCVETVSYFQRWLEKYNKLQEQERHSSNAKNKNKNENIYISSSKVTTITLRTPITAITKLESTSHNLQCLRQAISLCCDRSIKFICSQHLPLPSFPGVSWVTSLHLPFPLGKYLLRSPFCWVISYPFFPLHHGVTPSFLLPFL